MQPQLAAVHDVLSWILANIDKPDLSPEIPFSRLQKMKGFAERDRFRQSVTF